MNLRIEDYALIGNLHTAALVGRDGSIDWLYVPRFDSPACFAALLGGSGYGRWLIAPQGRVKTTRRNYRRDTLILETIFETESGEVALIDFMPVKEQTGEVGLIRLVEGRMDQFQCRWSWYSVSTMAKASRWSDIYRTEFEQLSARMRS